VLAQIATILKSCVRGSEYVIRYGGDEFLVLLPETDDTGGEIVRQRVHRKVSEWDRSNRVGDLPISVSLGLYLHVTGQTADKDVAEADARMYAEKQATKRAAISNSSPLPQ
jgi:diguanylate cyclase (GGDEF)-like protein